MDALDYYSEKACCLVVFLASLIIILQQQRKQNAHKPALSYLIQKYLQNISKISLNDQQNLWHTIYYMSSVINNDRSCYMCFI